jgi:hypothetical protein
LERCGAPREDYEIIVVDNASTDGSPEAIRSLADLVICLTSNRGSCAKAFGLSKARGRFIVFLDDDAAPEPYSLGAMIEHFEDQPDLGAAGFTVHLPDGSREESALPGVFHGCCVGFRADALHAVGGMDPTFFMQAEEYDLTFRLVHAGWSVRNFEDLNVHHLKTTQARREDRTAYYDVRNNLRVAARYLPTSAYAIYRTDWLQRYAWLAERGDRRRAHRKGRRDGRLLAFAERWTFRRKRLKPEAFEHFFRWEYVRRKFEDLKQQGVGRVLLVGLGKNLYAFHRAAELNGMKLSAIGDDVFGAPGRLYRGTRLLHLKDACETAFYFDVAVVTSMTPYFAEQAVRSVTPWTTRPIFHWSATLDSLARSESLVVCGAV